MADNMMELLEKAAVKAVSPFIPQGKEVSSYVWDGETGRYVKGHGHTEYITADTGDATDTIGTAYAEIGPGKMSESDHNVVFRFPGKDHLVAFTIRNDWILTVHICGDYAKASECIERFVPAFSEAMGGLDRFKKKEEEGIS
jgi:hypothetical protein